MTDTYDPIVTVAEAAETITTSGEVFQGVWATAAGWRRNGTLLELGKHIQCPVVALHGDYDPHPAEGVQKPLSALLRDFRFVLLQHCGHTPWRERQARDSFYQAVRRELA
jgi:pimeloyl-ACP methyl ester carboxylesterase